MYLVSACLLGKNCKYDGKNNRNETLINFLNESDEECLTICPEQLGGMGTPRKKAEIADKKSGKDVIIGNAIVIDEDGKDLTENYLLGAQNALLQIKHKKIKMAILKSKSPSCGCGYIYDGTFSGNLIEGEGVTAALLIKSGIKVYSEENFIQGEKND